ncbi:MAG: LysM peptidoglycan-binding domain-containing protein [Clostridia bacterium]|nr:LysM peptidoglycan-binding domain-containing protein [Clostridia bacterium]
MWKIAKRFRSTVEAISTLNGIEDVNNLQIGEQLFIPMTT